MVECCEDRKLFESEKFCLPYSELRCLMMFPGERYLTVKGLARKLDVAKSRVTKVAGALMKKGYLEQIDDPRDRRIRLLSLTQKGVRKSEEIAEFQREIHEKILLEMDSWKRQDVLSHLEMLRASMEAVKEQLV